MATFLKMVSGIYLVLVWLPVLGLFTGLHTPTLDASLGETGTKALAILVAVGLTIPGCRGCSDLLKLLGDVRAMRLMLGFRGSIWPQCGAITIRQPYEPQRPPNAYCNDRARDSCPD